MADKERRLGRGLDALISGLGGPASRAQETAREAAEVDRDLALADLDPNPFQPRRDFPLEALDELVESLRNHGLLQPIVVRAAGKRYEILAGERRWRAAQELGWERIRAVVRPATDDQMLEWAIVENIQREDLNPIELARACKRLQETSALTQENLARRLGKSRSAVANSLRLLDLPQGIQSHVSRGTISMGAARALLPVKPPELQNRLAEQVAKGLLSVRQVEAAAKSAANKSHAPRRHPDPNAGALAEELQRLLGTRVALHGSLKRGRVVIQYFTSRQLDHLVRGLREAAAFNREPGETGEGEQTLVV
jgi:ParB family chromosome partitioning protein